MTEQKTKTEVLIVGAGPTGLVMALCLAKCGVHSIVVERQHDVNPHPKAHELNTRSLEILASIGITLDELRAEASPKSDGCRIAFCTTINDEFGAIDLLKDIEDPDKYRRHLESDDPYLNISQAEVEHIIRRRVAKCPEIDLRLGQQWQSYIETSEQTTSTIRDRADGWDYEIDADWLIAADGAGSRVREALGIRMIGPEKIQDFKNAYFEINLRDKIERPAKLYWTFEPSASGTFIAHHIDKRWVYNVPIYEPWERAEDYTDELLVERIKRALGRDDIDIEIKSTSVWRMTVQTAGKWRKDRVFLVGDAAHRFPPTGGLGMNSGIGDAHNLAWKLAQVIKAGSDSALLDTYEVERKPVAERNAAESFDNYTRMLDVIKGIGLDPNGAEKAARLRASTIMRWLPNSIRAGVLNLLNGIVRDRIQKTLADENSNAQLQATIRDQFPHFDRIGLDLGYVYESDAIESDGSVAPPVDVTRYVPSCHPGARFPHIWLSPDTQSISSHSLLDFGSWTLIWFGMGSENVHQLSRELDHDRIQRVDLDRLDIPDAGKQALIDLCDIGPTGFILIRPDGHVGMRQNTVTETSFGKVKKHLDRWGIFDPDRTSVASAS